MKIINYNSSALLFEKVEELEKTRHNSWRCIYINLAKMQRSYNPALRVNFIVKNIYDMLAEYDGTIYLCEDSDVFILFQGTIKSIIAKLSEHFADMDADMLKSKPGEKLFSIFDLSKYWQEFYELCEGKYVSATALASKPPASTGTYYF